jgi:hypothetical protein
MCVDGKCGWVQAADNDFECMEHFITVGLPKICEDVRIWSIAKDIYNSAPAKIWEDVRIWSIAKENIS